MTDADRFLSLTEPIENGCVIFHGGWTGAGYGQFRVGRRKFYAHRYAWEQTNGPIPAGMVIDHTCHERSCVNLEHLRSVTRQQNQWNRSGAQANSATGLRGVVKRYGRYAAQVQCGGIKHNLGVYDTPEEASAVASAKRTELFGVYAGKATH